MKTRAFASATRAIATFHDASTRERRRALVVVISYASRRMKHKEMRRMNERMSLMTWIEKIQIFIN